jgi:hypothetical protein
VTIVPILGPNQSYGGIFLVFLAWGASRHLWALNVDDFVSTGSFCVSSPRQHCYPAPSLFLAKLGTNPSQPLSI